MDTVYTVSVGEASRVNVDLTVGGGEISHVAWKMCAFVGV
jgi:hypothetical protein